MAAAGTDFDENRRLLGTSINEQSGQNHAIDVVGGESGCTVNRFERGKAEAENQGAGARDMNGLGELVDAGSEEKMLAARELRVDCGGSVIGMRDVEAGKEGQNFRELCRSAR